MVQIANMSMDASVPTWEENWYKSVVSQLQIDAQAKNLKKSRINQLPQEHDQLPMAVFKTMEVRQIIKYSTIKYSTIKSRTQNKINEILLSS